MSVTRRLFRVLLSAAMLLVGVPAWQHSHVGGNRAHGHSHDGENEGVGESHAHMHVTLFGVEFTIPMESDEDDSEEGQTTFLVVAPTIIDLTHAWHFADLTQPIPDVGEPVQIVPTFRSIAASAAPLCDTARHERSGVQLI